MAAVSIAVEGGERGPTGARGRGDGGEREGRGDRPSSSFPADFPEIDPSSWSVKFFSCSQRISICSSGSAGSSFGLNASAPTVKKPSLMAT